MNAHSNVTPINTKLTQTEHATNDAAPEPKSYYKRKFAKVDLTDRTIDLSDMKPDTAWEFAKDHVTMGVAVVPGFAPSPGYKDNGEITVNGEHQAAEYATDTGREGQFFFVMIDRDNTNDWKALTPCSDYYAAIEPRQIFEGLQEMLSDFNAQPMKVYNAFNGGSQDLLVEIGDMDSIQKVEGLKIQVVLKTSLDRTSNHAMSVRPVTASGVPIYFTDTGKNGFNFKVRHTTQAKESIIDFNIAAGHIIANWNANIVPYVNFLADGDLNEQEIIALMDSIMEDAKLPEKAQEEIKSAYKAKLVDMGDIKSDALRAVATICDHNENADSPLKTRRDADKIGKALTNRVKQLFTKHYK